MSRKRADQPEPRSPAGDAAPSPPARVVIASVEPSVDGGRFPIKRTVGEEVIVSADIFADGQDLLAAVLRYRELGSNRFDQVREGSKGFDRTLSNPIEPNGTQSNPEWREVPMTPVGDDRWEGRFRVERVGRAEYSIEAWIDRLGTLRDGLGKKIAAGQAVDLELVEEAELARQDARQGAAALERPLEVIVERERARVGAWYEMFPRSYSPEPGRSATFDEAARRLPGIAAMGFDVVYLAPIHPIGTTFRKGRNNALEAGASDPGSPWAIGSSAGGHKAIEPGLGTLDDFDRFVETAEGLGLEVALDLAYQASPDHPYVTEHPEWFRHRPDGSIKYAENPPKKYQDIYPFDFESADWRALWAELQDIVRFWIARGVKIFRVDNPHTKPFGFWETMIAEIRRDHGDVILLSEAFTRPKVMRHLAKLGFSQSYTYFTWRNTKAELTDYFTELTQTDVREYMRTNLFANTPDILHAYLQRGGPAAFRARLVLAATLGASYGIYSGFELCENRAVAPESEEYLNSEKFEYRHWDWDQPGNIRDLIARVNLVRREHPALQSDWTPSNPRGTGLRFHDTDNDQILCYSKSTADLGDLVLVVVCLDPVNMQHGWVRVPAADWKLPDAYDAHDAVTGETYRWHGEWNYVRFDPPTRVAHVLVVRRG